MTKLINLPKSLAIAVLALVTAAPAVSLMTTPAYAQTQSGELAKIFNQVAKHKLVRAKFAQQKKLANSDKVFYSAGNITFAKNTGVLWLMNRPVKADLIMTDQYVIQKTANTQSKISLAQNQYAGVASVFLQILTGNQAALLKNFKVEQTTHNAGRWTLVLSPRNTTLTKLFDKITLSGGEFAEQIVIDEKKGGKTTITLSSHEVGSTLTTDEVALFGLAK